MFHIFLIVCTLGLPCQWPDKATDLSEAKEWSINLRQCNQETRNSYRKFGAERVRVIGRLKGYCRIELRTETEGFYKTSDCRIPIRLKELKVIESKESAKNETHIMEYSPHISKYCRMVKSGNVLMERAN